MRVPPSSDIYSGARPSARAEALAVSPGGSTSNAGQAVSPGSTSRGRRNFPVTNAPGRLTGDWFSADLGVNQSLFQTIRGLRNRVRQLARENDLVRGYLKTMKRKVIGAKPIRFQAKARMAQGGKMVLDKAANATLEAAFEDFSRRGKFDVTRQLSRQAFECLVVETCAVDGEFLARKIRGFGNGYGFALQVLDAAALDETLNIPRGPGRNEIRLGVELDAWNAPVAYHFREAENSAQGIPSSAAQVRIPAAEIIHAFVVERPNQVRGVSWFCSSGLRLKLLDGYEQAVVIGKRVAAAKLGFLIQGGGEDFDGDGVDAEGRRLLSADPGEMEVLPKGTSFAEWSPPDMAETIAEFERTIKQGLSVGMSLSYPAFSGDMTSMSYSSLRHGELGDRDVYAGVQGMVIDQVNDAYIGDWTLMAMTVGAVNLPMSKFSNFANWAWSPRRWEWVAPEKMLQAMKMKYEMGVSLTELLAEMGYDIDEQAELIASEPDISRFFEAMKYQDDPDLNDPAPAPSA